MALTQFVSDLSDLDGLEDDGSGIFVLIPLLHLLLVVHHVPAGKKIPN